MKPTVNPDHGCRAASVESRRTRTCACERACTDAAQNGGANGTPSVTHRRRNGGGPRRILGGKGQERSGGRRVTGIRCGLARSSHHPGVFVSSADGERPVESRAVEPRDRGNGARMSGSNGGYSTHRNEKYFPTQGPALPLCGW